MAFVAPPRDDAARAALIQIAALGALYLLVCRAGLTHVVEAALSNPEWAHTLAAPVLVALLAWLRRRELKAAIGPGSAWGMVILVLAILLYAGSEFPFAYSYPRRFSLILGLLGVTVISAGWRFARCCIPMFLILLLAVPIPTRQIADMVIRPETLTLQATAATLDMLPGVRVDLTGADLHYATDDSSGTVALGEPWRGASLLFASATLGLFVIFARIRPWWQVAVLLGALPLVVLLINWFRLELWGLVTIYGRADPLSALPRIVATTGSLLACYGAFALSEFLLGRKKPPGDFSADALPRSHSRLGPAEKSPGDFFLTPVFIAAASILLVAAVGLDPLLDYLIREYTKEPIGVLRSLDEFDASAIESFRVVTDDPTFKLAIDPGVGTDAAVRRVFQPRGHADRKRDEDTLLFVTYYNNPRGSVPHTPEVCYRQIGALIHSIKSVTIPLRGPGIEPASVTARLLDLEPPGWHGALVYVFVCNGKVYHDRKSVRWAIGRPGDRRVYFSKVEVVSRCDGDDCHGALERASLLLAEALPVLMRDHFPGRADVER